MTTKPSKALLIIGIVAASLVVVLILAGIGAFIFASRPYSSPALTRRVETAVAQATKGRCALGSLEITLLKGVVADSIRLTISTAPRCTLSCTAARLRVTYRPMMLVHNWRLVLREIRGKPAQTASSSTPSRPPATFADQMRALTDGPWIRIVNGVELSGVNVRVEQKGATTVDVHGGAVELTVRKPEVPVIGGEISAQRVAVDVWTFDDFSTQVALDPSSIGLSKLSARCLDGKISADGGIQPDAEMLSGLTVAIIGLNVSKLYALLYPNSGTAEGSAALNVTMEKSALVVDSLRGNGTVTITDVKIKDLPIQQKLFLEQLLPELGTLSFSKVASDVQMRKARIYTPNLKAEGHPLTVTTAGWTGVTGKMDHTIEGVLAKEYVEPLGTMVKESLKPMPNGDYSFKCRAKGTFSDPKIILDQELVKRTINSVINEAVKTYGKDLKKYFR